MRSIVIRADPAEAGRLPFPTVVSPTRSGVEDLLEVPNVIQGEEAPEATSTNYMPPAIVVTRQQAPPWWETGLLGTAREWVFQVASFMPCGDRCEAD
jgi:hypothetical protein